MSADKYPCIFSRQMATIVYLFSHFDWFAYDLLEDRHTIDVIVTKFFPLCFKMAERFENLDNILRDWARHKVQKSLAEALNSVEKLENER